jgi:hypothetical protein
MQHSAECLDHSKRRKTSESDLAVNVTSFDVCWKTDSEVDQPARRTKHSESTSNTIHTCEFLLRCGRMLKVALHYMFLAILIGNIVLNHTHTSLPEFTVLYTFVDTSPTMTFYMSKCVGRTEVTKNYLLLIVQFVGLNTI